VRGPLRGGLLPLLGFRAAAAQVVRIVWVFDETVIHVVADLLTFCTNEVNALDGLVDAFAVEDSTLELLDSNSKQRFVLTLDLPATNFVLR
jgi:hypothetical protein